MFVKLEITDMILDKLKKIFRREQTLGMEQLQHIEITVHGYKNPWLPKTEPEEKPRT